MGIRCYGYFNARKNYLMSPMCCFENNDSMLNIETRRVNFGLL